MFKINALLFKFVTFVAFAVCPMFTSADSLRDPTRPLNYSAAAGVPVEWELNAVLIGGSRKLAVINGEQLRENEILPGSADVRLQAIEAHAVILQQGTRTWRLRLAGNDVRRAVATEKRVGN